MNNEQLYEQLRRKRSHPLLNKWLRRWTRQPTEQWDYTRQRIWKRDKGECQSPQHLKDAGVCKGKVKLKDCHIDHVQPLSSGGSNHASNLRILCPVCHALREDVKHKSLRDRMVCQGKLPQNLDGSIWN